MFNLVPFAGARREVAHGKGKPGLIGQFLQFYLPQPQSPAIAAPSVGGNQELVRLGIKPSAFMVPPAADRSHGKGSGIVIGANIDESDIASQVIDAVRVGAGHIGAGKIMPLYHSRLFGWAPLLAGIMIISYEFLFFVSTEITGRPCLRYRLTAALIYRNCASRSGCPCPSSVLRLLCRL